MDKIAETIVRMRMHGLYLSRTCPDLVRLSRQLLGMHCWFHRNVVFSALIRGADITGWKHALTKTWLYRGTLHGVVYDELPLLLALHVKEPHYDWFLLSDEQGRDVRERVISLMEDGVFSRAEMRRIFAADYDYEVVKRLFSPWGGIFVSLARSGQVAFRDMTSRDFDLIDAEPVHTRAEVLPELLERYFRVYGPATLSDAAWFFGVPKEELRQPMIDLPASISAFEYGKKVFYCAGNPARMRDIPELTLLSGFDPLIASYTGMSRSIVLPEEHRKAVISKAGICLPTIAVNGQVAGIWNIKKGQTVVEFFGPQPERIREEAYERADEIRRRTAGIL